jgi:hypothetical protein
MDFLTRFVHTVAASKNGTQGATLLPQPTSTITLYEDSLLLAQISFEKALKITDRASVIGSP